MRFRNITRRQPRHDPLLAKTHMIRFVDPNGTELTAAMGPGDAAAYGGVRVDIHHDRIDVTPHAGNTTTDPRAT